MLTSIVAWTALVVGATVAAAFVITSATVYTRENRRFADINDKVAVVKEDLADCYCDTFFFDDIFTILNEDDPSRAFMFFAGSIAANTTRIYAMPNKNGTVALLDDLPTAFADDEFVVFDAANIFTRIMFDVSLVSPFTTRTYTWPNKDGVVAMISDIVQNNTTRFLDSDFAILNAIDITKEAMFDAASITTATTRTYAFPNKDGTFALLSDIVQDNNTRFLDSAFEILNNPDTTKVATFSASAIGTATTRTYLFPDISGTLALTAGTQTLSDKTLDNSNTINVLDALLSIQDIGDNTKVATFDASAITTATTQIYAFPDLSGTLVLTTGVQTLSDKTLDNSNSITVLDMLLDIQDNGDNTKVATFDCGLITTATTRVYSFPDLNGVLVLTAGAQALSDKTLDNSNTIIVLDTLLDIQDNGDITKVAMFNAALITTATTRTYSFPDLNGVLVLTVGTQTLSSKTLDNSNTITVLDTLLDIQDNGDITKVATFNAALITTATTRTYAFPNKDGTLALLSDIVQANNTQFLDSAFAILNDPDTSKVATFNASLITTATTRTYLFPDLDGVLVLTAGTQTLSDKTLDNSNTVTVLDTLLDIQDNGDTSKVAKFDSSLITTATTRTFSFPDASIGLAGLNANDILVSTASPILLNDGTVQIVDGGDLTKKAQFQCSGITAATTRTFTFPDLSGTLLLTAGAQTISDKTLDNSNTITVLDTLLDIQAAGNASKVATFDASSISTTRVYTFPDSDGTLALNLISDGFFAERVGNQAIPNLAAQTVIFNDDTNQLGNDLGGNYDNATGMFTTPFDGFYDISYHLEWINDNSNSQFVGNIILNSPSRGFQLNLLRDLWFSDAVQLAQPSNEGTLLHADMRAGDTVIVQAFQTSGTNRNIRTESLFSVTRVG